MRRYPHIWRPIIASALAIGVAPPVSAQNGSSFLNAHTAHIDYTATASRAMLTCTSLRALGAYSYTIISTTLVAATADTPEHCRVYGAIRPEIRFGLHLPTAWNGRFYMQGNGGYAGNSPSDDRTLHTAMRAVRHGFAVATTDTGHDSRVEPLATFARNNLAKEIDYGFRAVHLTARTAKSLIATYYDHPPSYSYWDGCSTGGRQGLMSAQRFPADFDGIVAGAPVLNFTDTQMAYIWNNQALVHASPSETTIAQVGKAVYQHCDAIDGLEDGLIDDPRRCDFDPARDLPRCTETSGEACVTADEIASLQAIYRGPVAGGTSLFPGQPLGAEVHGGWTNWIISDTGPTIGQRFSETFFKYLAFTPDEPDFDWRAFDFETDPARVTIREILDATDPDLAAFQARGGKMITHFGWADTALNPMMAVNYYEDVQAANDAATTTDFYRLFMVPGMFHCRGGIGTDRFDAMTPLIDWVEGAIAPDSIPAARIDDGKVVRTRPLCPYPQVATYTGAGSIDDATNFVCRAR